MLKDVKHERTITDLEAEAGEDNNEFVDRNSKGESKLARGIAGHKLHHSQSSLGSQQAKEEEEIIQEMSYEEGVYQVELERERE